VVRRVGRGYSGGFVKPQTNAVVARIDTDGSTTDLCTFIVGAGVLTYTDGWGISIDATTPQVTDIAGFGYAAWTASGEPVLVMAADPTALLDDPAFSMSVSNDNNGDATLDFQSLPPRSSCSSSPTDSPERRPQPTCPSLHASIALPAWEACRRASTTRSRTSTSPRVRRSRRHR